MKILDGGLGALLLVALMNAQTRNPAVSCEGLASLTLPSTTITQAQVVPAGGFSRSATGTSSAQQAFSNSVAFCRVAATLKPSSDSDIKIEVWLPMSGWNGKFQAVGNGGWAGTISYPAMAEALGRGYATTSTATGHASAGGSFALGHPEKFIDFAYRAVHEMTVKAKVIVNAFYGSAPTYAYWNGCSTGGRQGLAEVQRYPNDFDGVIGCTGKSEDALERVAAGDWTGGVERSRSLHSEQQVSGYSQGRRQCL